VRRERNDATTARNGTVASIPVPVRAFVLELLLREAGTVGWSRRDELAEFVDELGVPANRPQSKLCAPGDEPQDVRAHWSNRRGLRLIAPSNRPHGAMTQVGQ
jgi:hypothetical protein